MAIKYVGPFSHLQNYRSSQLFLMMLDGKILRALFEHERLKPAIVRTSQGNVHSLAQLKWVMTLGMVI